MVFLYPLDSCVMMYLHDLLIFSKTDEEHWKVLDIVFAHLAKHQLYLRLKKYTLLLKHVEFLGHILDTLGVHI